MWARVNQKKSVWQFEIMIKKFRWWSCYLSSGGRLETVSGILPGERAQPLGPTMGWWLSWNPSSGSCLSLSWIAPGVSWLVVNVVNWVSLRLCPLNRLSPSSLGCRSSSHETVTPHSNYNRAQQLNNQLLSLSFLTL